MNWHGEIISACVETWQCAPIQTTSTIPVGRIIAAQYDGDTLFAFTTNATAERIDLAKTAQIFNATPEELERNHPELIGLIQRTTTAQVWGRREKNPLVDIPGLVPPPHTRISVLDLKQTKELLDTQKTLVGLLRILKERDVLHSISALKILLSTLHTEFHLCNQEKERLGRAFAEIYHLDYTIVESFILFLENL